MSNKNDRKIVIFRGDEEDLSWVHQIQDEYEQKGKLNCLVFVPTQGTEDKYLYSQLFLVENYESSLENHFLWNGLIDDEEQKKYIEERVEDFFEKGERLVIEHYEFLEDEPFYDYSR